MKAIKPVVTYSSMKILLQKELINDVLPHAPSPTMTILFRIASICMLVLDFIEKQKNLVFILIDNIKLKPLFYFFIIKFYTLFKLKLVNKK